MPLFRYATSVYGEDVLLGASWDLIWWFIGAGVAFIVVHALMSAFTGAGSRRPEL